MGLGHLLTLTFESFSAQVFHSQQFLSPTVERESSEQPRFSVRYDKGGSEKEFGMFGYGDCPLVEMTYSGKAGQ